MMANIPRPSKANKQPTYPTLRGAQIGWTFGEINIFLILYLMVMMVMMVMVVTLTLSSFDVDDQSGINSAPFLKIGFLDALASLETTHVSQSVSNSFRKVTMQP